MLFTKTILVQQCSISKYIHMPTSKGASKQTKPKMHFATVYTLLQPEQTSAGSFSFSWQRQKLFRFPEAHAGDRNKNSYPYAKVAARKIYLQLYIVANGMFLNTNILTPETRLQKAYIVFLHIEAKRSNVRAFQGLTTVLDSVHIKVSIPHCSWKG